MRIDKTICDYCHREITGDFFTVHRKNRFITKGLSDYCEECWNKAHTPLPITPYIEEEDNE